FFSSYCAHRDLHSFPTRRSSDLQAAAHWPRNCSPKYSRTSGCASSCPGWSGSSPARSLALLIRARSVRHSLGFKPVSDSVRPGRSEEHTSELQSLTNLLCRLLLE